MLYDSLLGIVWKWEVVAHKDAPSCWTISVNCQKWQAVVKIVIRSIRFLMLIFQQRLYYSSLDIVGKLLSSMVRRK